MQRRLAAFILALLTTALHAESNWSDPHPQRRDALVNGRDFEYNREAFLHRVSYRHLSLRPAPGEDGLYGTGGSITGDELYVDINLQKTLYFDDQRHAIIARMQRREDFDGRFDRQLIGIGRRFGNDWQVNLLGDIRADKSETDIHLEASWLPDRHRNLRMAVVFTDPLFNDKTSGGGEYKTTPVTYFAHFRQPLPGGAFGEIAVNLSPTARFESAATGDTASGNQRRLMGSVTVPLIGDWQTRLRVEGERTNRRFRFQRPSPPAADDFERRMHNVTWQFSAPDQRFAPHFGLSHFRLREDGWFGDARTVSGKHHRDEYGVFGGITYRTTDRQRWEPTIYIRYVDYERELLETPGRNRDEQAWVGKIALPWRYVVDMERGAVITISPTFRLHTVAFGGGNVQLHWPF